MPDNMNRAIIMSDGSILWVPQVIFMSGGVAKAKDSVQVTKVQKLLYFLDRYLFLDNCVNF